MNHTLSESEMAYIGGIMDGEGSINLNITVRESHGIGYAMMPDISVGMADSEETQEVRSLLIRLYDDLGVNYYDGVREYDKVNHNDAWHVAVRSVSGAKAVLEAVKPYLRVKSVHADIVLSVNWDEVNRSPEAFIEGMEQRERLRGFNGSSTTKYTVEKMKSELLQDSV